MKTSLILEAKDRASRIVDRVGRSVQGLRTRGITPLGRAMDSVDRVSGRFLVRLPGRLGTVGSSLLRRVGEMRLLERASYTAGYAIGFTARKLAGLALRAGTGLAVGGIAAAGFFGTWLTSGVIATASKFEQFQVVLENTEGSAAKARAAMAWVKDFGKTTPYEVGEVMEAFVALKSYGIDPMHGALRSLGNASSGMNKPLMQSVEMLADAQTGEFERLKEFGVRAKVAGDKVTFTYMRAGKEITRTSKNSAAEIQRSVLGIFDERFSGMMDRQSRTVAGMWSNLQDMVANFQLDVAGSGFFDVVKGKLQQLLDGANRLAKDGTLLKWANEVSARLVAMVNLGEKFVRETDWKAVGSDLATVARFAWDLVRAIAAAVRLAQQFSTMKLTAPGALWTTLASPNNPDPVSRFLATPLWGKDSPYWKSASPPVPAPARRAPRPGPAVPLPGLMPRSGGWPTGTVPAPKPGKVAVDIRLSGPGAPQASVASLRSEGPAVANVRRGMAMGAPA